MLDLHRQQPDRLALTIMLLAGVCLAMACAKGGVSTPNNGGPINHPNSPSNNCPVTACNIGEVTCAGVSQVVRCEDDGVGCGTFLLVMNCNQGATCNGGECLMGCIDEDGDQHGDACPLGRDCDDSDPERYHGAEEVCDEKDNDCDGQTDEGGACSTDCTGQECSPGTRECVNAQQIRECRPGPDRCGRWTSPVDCGAEGCNGDACSGCSDNDGDQRGEGCALGSDCDDADGTRYQDAPELCDGIDNDCDDDVDEDFVELSEPCTAGIGACQATGMQVCDSGGTFVVCDAVPGTNVDELCGDGIDNDCDESIDEGFDGLGNGCTSGVGACQRSGSMICNSAGTDLECDATPGNPAAEEICSDELDNDCNGQINDGCNPDTCFEDDLEENDTSGSGTDLPAATSLDGTLCGNVRGEDLDEDWFILGHYNTGQSMTVELTFDNPGAIHAEIYTSSFKNSSTGSSPQTVSFTADASTTYRVWIVPNNNPVSGTNYTVTHVQ